MWFMDCLLVIIVIVVIGDMNQGYGFVLHNLPPSTHSLAFMDYGHFIDTRASTSFQKVVMIMLVTAHGKEKQME